MSERIVDKIRKLLSLAQSDNPHEAALAAQRAQELMIEHAVSEDRVRGADGKEANAEPIAAETLWDYSGRKTWNAGTSYEKTYAVSSKIPEWHVSLAGAMARSFLCRIYYTPGRSITMVGRTSAREAFAATWAFVRGEVQRLCDQEWETGKAPGEHGRRWKTAFCAGAVSTISERLRENMRRLEAGTPAPGGISSSGIVLAPAHDAPPVSSTAIVLRSRQEEVDVWLEAKVKLRAGRATYRGGRSGYAEGRAAGHAIPLGKRATKHLGEG